MVWSSSEKKDNSVKCFILEKKLRDDSQEDEDGKKSYRPLRN
jgi:hypothetical protein